MPEPGVVSSRPGHTGLCKQHGPEPTGRVDQTGYKEEQVIEES